MVESTEQFHIQFQKHFMDGDHVMYHILLFSKEDSNKSIEFSDRYSSLLDLHNKFSKESNSKNYPKFPPKKYLGSKEEKFLNQRLSALQSYFSNILSHKEFSQLKSVRAWIADLMRKYYKSEKKQDQVKPKDEKEVKKVQMTSSEKENGGQMKDMLSQFDEIVKRYSKQFIDLTPEMNGNLDSEEFHAKEKKYNEVLSKFEFNSQLFDIPKGNDNNFQCLGLDESEVDNYKKFMNEKLKDMAESISFKIAEGFNTEKLIINVIEAKS